MEVIKDESGKDVLHSPQGKILKLDQSPATFRELKPYAKLLRGLGYLPDDEEALQIIRSGDVGSSQLDDMVRQNREMRERAAAEDAAAQTRAITDLADPAT